MRQRLLSLSLAAAIALAAAGPALTAATIHVEWMRGTTVYGAQTITSSGASVVTSAAPNFGGGVPGVARITVLAGAAVITWGPGVSATQTNGVRAEPGSDPFNIPVNVGDVVAIIQATDAQSALSVVCH